MKIQKLIAGPVILAGIFFSAAALAEKHLICPYGEGPGKVCYFCDDSPGGGPCKKVIMERAAF